MATSKTEKIDYFIFTIDLANKCIDQQKDIQVKLFELKTRLDYLEKQVTKILQKIASLSED